MKQFPQRLLESEGSSMDAASGLWTSFTQIVEHLTAGDDPHFWRVTLERIFDDANLLCRSYRGKEHVFAQIGSCSHWMSPHNKGSWFSDVRFARPTGYGCSGFSIYGLPEFDWFKIWQYDGTRNDAWTPVGRIYGKRPLVLRIALSARTARHVRAVVHAFWTPGSPTMPKEKLLQGYAFQKQDEQWCWIETVGQEKPYIC